jgi:hypothetical protein
MSLNVGDQEYNGGKKYRQKGTLCGPNKSGQAFQRAIMRLIPCQYDPIRGTQSQRHLNGQNQ